MSEPRQVLVSTPEAALAESLKATNDLGEMVIALLHRVERLEQRVRELERRNPDR